MTFAMGTVREPQSGKAGSIRGFRPLRRRQDAEMIDLGRNAVNPQAHKKKISPIHSLEPFSAKKSPLDNL